MNQTFFDSVNSKCISFDGVPKIADFGDENDLIRRGDALKAIRKACISAHLPFDSATPEGKRVMDALYAVWKVKKRGKERKRSMTVFDANCIYTIKCLALIFVAAPGAMLIGALLIYLFALCCKQISGLWREQK